MLEQPAIDEALLTINKNSWEYYISVTKQRLIVSQGDRVLAEENGVLAALISQINNQLLSIETKLRAKKLSNDVTKWQELEEEIILVFGNLSSYPSTKDAIDRIRKILNYPQLIAYN